MTRASISEVEVQYGLQFQALTLIAPACLQRSARSADELPIVNRVNCRQKKRKSDRRAQHARIWKGSTREHERTVRAEVRALEAFAFLDVVSTVLAVAIDRAAASQGSAPSRELRKTALLFAAIRAFRGIRAASAVIASGYALEAEPYTRMLLELYVAARAVVDDETESEAREWLAGQRARGIGERVKAAIPDASVYGHLSQATHGDPRAIPRALLRVAEGEQTIDWGPRLTAQTEEQLHHLAFAARDFSVLLEQVGFDRQPELDTVDQALQRIKPSWRPDAVYPTSGPEF